MTGEPHLVAIAHASGGHLTVYRVALTPEQRSSLEELLAWLTHFGRLVATLVVREPPVDHVVALKHDLRDCFGTLLLDAISDQSRPADEPPSAFLLPVWPFEDGADGKLVASARFQSLEMDVIARPNPDEEVGIMLPGRQGTYLPIIMPHSAQIGAIGRRLSTKGARGREGARTLP